MGEELEHNKLYIKSEDGMFIPFEGITQSDDIVICDEMNQGLYDSLPREGGTICFSADCNLVLDSKSHSKLVKKLKNKFMRRIRHYKRMKEKARRKALKNARHT